MFRESSYAVLVSNIVPLRSRLASTVGDPPHPYPPKVFSAGLYKGHCLLFMPLSLIKKESRQDRPATRGNLFRFTHICTLFLPSAFRKRFPLCHIICHSLKFISPQADLFLLHKGHAPMFPAGKGLYTRWIIGARGGLCSQRWPEVAQPHSLSLVLPVKSFKLLDNLR